jgi:hypothetical protein
MLARLLHSQRDRSQAWLSPFIGWEMKRRNEKSHGNTLAVVFSGATGRIERLTENRRNEGLIAAMIAIHFADTVFNAFSCQFIIWGHAREYHHSSSEFTFKPILILPFLVNSEDRFLSRSPVDTHRRQKQSGFHLREGSFIFNNLADVCCQTFAVSLIVLYNPVNNLHLPISFNCSCYSFHGINSAKT